MEVEMTAEAKDKKLNRRVAITVVVLSIFTGVGNIKDGNIVQAMAQAKADSVDRWNQYQATRTKLHIAQTSATELGVIATVSPAARGAAAPAIAAITRDIAKYRVETPALANQAKALAASYDELNVHDDQFDASEAAIATAIAMAAVAALVDSQLTLTIAWVFGAFGIFMGVCGFAKLPFHPDVLSSWLG